MADKIRKMDANHTVDDIDRTIDEVSDAIGDAQSLSARLAEKLDISDIDSALSTESENPVQNKAVAGAVSALADCGAKNLLPNPHTSDVKNGVTITVNPDGSVLMSGTATADVSLILPVILQPGAYILTGCPAGGGSGTNYRMPLRKIDGNVYVGADYGSGYSFSVDEETAYNVLLYVPKNVVCDNLLFQPMVRRAELTDSIYQPYAPTNRQLYEMILALQSGNQVQSVQSTAQLMASSDSEEETR